MLERKLKDAATRCVYETRIDASKCVCGRPWPAGGSLQRSPDPLAGFGEGECHGKGSVGNGREGERKEEEGKGRAGTPAGFLARVG